MRNSFFGRNAGFSNTEGNFNSFFGRAAGFNNTLGSSNTMIGDGANVGFNNLVNATAIGAGALVSQNNSLVLGNNSVNVGIGTSFPSSRLHVEGNVVVGFSGFTLAGQNALFLANDSGTVDNDFRVDAANNTLYIIARSNPGSGAGVGIVFRTAPAGGGEIDRVGINGDGSVRINVLGGAGATDVCRNADFALSTCSSSLRYKSDVRTFTGGLDVVSRLRPISFNWKQSGMRDVGFGAEEVEKIEPLLATFNDKGEIEGVKYKQITTVLVNAVKEQQAQLQQQQKLIEQLQTRLTRIESNAKRSQGVRRRSVR